MKHLLDINVLIPAIWGDHSQHARAKAWLEGKEIALCPIAELGFLRISTNRRAIGAGMDKAREALTRFARDKKADWIADDLRALDSRPKTSDEVTDHYLADLAAKHGLTLATFDAGLKHRSATLIPV